MKEMNRISKKALSPARLAACTIGLAAMGLSLAGCGIGLSSSSSKTGTSSTGATKPGMSGLLHGGQQPIYDAQIQVYAVGTSGSTALITPGAGGIGGSLTNASGTFNLAGLLTCPSPSPQIYLVAIGGSSQGVGGTANSAATLMAPLGDCATVLSTAPFVQINEVTTVAAAYALAGSMTSYSHVVGGNSTATSPAIVASTAIFNSMVSLVTGLVATNSGITVPTAEIYTLADILASCINTSNNPGNTDNLSSACLTLYNATGATDTVGMALYFATHPASSTLLALYSAGGSTPPFQPTFTAQPTDWTIALKYTAGGVLSAPYGIAIDSTGNAWVSNASGTTVTEIAPGGTAGTILTGLTGPKGLAIDNSNNVWVANPPANAVVKFANGSTTGTSYTVGGLNGPVALAIDSGSNVWVANLTGNSVTELSSAGAAKQTSLTAGGAISGPTGIAIAYTGGNGAVYVANSGGGNVVRLSNSSPTTTYTTLSDLALQGTTAVALDSATDVWATGSTTGTAVAGAVSQFSSGAAVAASPFSGGALSLPSGVATSGTTAWVTNNQSAGSLSEITVGQTSPTSPSVGFGVANSMLGIVGMNSPVGLAIDASGNVWTANSGDNTVSVFVGLASPVTTPIAANVGP